MKIALVGPTGVLGRALVPLLLQEGHSVRALARSVAKARTQFPDAVEIEACDLLEPGIAARLPALLNGCDAVAHIATAIPRDGTRPGAWDANTRLRTEGVRALLAAVTAAGVRYYVQQSITMAYPDCGDAWIDEAVPLATGGSVRTPVAVMEEQVRALLAGAIRWCILRGANFVGPATAQESLIERLRAGQQPVPADGSNFVSLVHVSDVASAFAATFRRAPDGATLNICAEPIRYGEYLDRLAERVGGPRPRRDPAEPRAPSWRCSNAAARNVLQWSPVHPIIPLHLWPSGFLPHNRPVTLAALRRGLRT